MESEAGGPSSNNPPPMAADRLLASHRLATPRCHSLAHDSWVVPDLQTLDRLQALARLQADHRRATSFCQRGTS